MAKKNFIPSIIRDNKFSSEGFVETESGLMVPAYVGSGLGFNEPGVFYLKHFYEELKKRKVFPLCPFIADGEYLDLSRINEEMSVKKHKKFWRGFNRQAVGKINYEMLLPYSRFMIALFDCAGPGSDDGMCSEITFSAMSGKQVIGIRSDFRQGENIATGINPAVRYFLDYGPYKGRFYDGPNAMRNGLRGIERLATEILRKSA
jgi:hypothetical protein